MEKYVPKIPFEGYKWFWATKQPTEALNDPAILLGVLRIIGDLAGRGYRYSSPAFSDGLRSLAADIPTSINLAERVGERNLMRNSGQYWSLLGLIPQGRHGGQIEITELGRAVASGEVEQGDFAALAISALTLPNATSYSEEEIADWRRCDLSIHPLRLILEVLRALNREGQGWLTPDELGRVVVPMAGDRRSAEEMAQWVIAYREDPQCALSWPDCVPRSNDKRFVREFLLFLANYGYVSVSRESGVRNQYKAERYEYLPELEEEIACLCSGNLVPMDLEHARFMRSLEVSSAVVSAVGARRAQRPGQARFRQELLASIGHCPVTNVDLPDVLEAAHIKPHAYGGKESIDNGWPMRVDVHRLFDAGLMRIRPDEGRWCVIEFTSDRARANYRSLDGLGIRLPEQTNRDLVEWRYENYLVGMRVSD